MSHVSRFLVEGLCLPPLIPPPPPAGNLTIYSCPSTTSIRHPSHLETRHICQVALLFIYIQHPLELP